MRSELEQENQEQAENSLRSTAWNTVYTNSEVVEYPEEDVNDAVETFKKQAEAYAKQADMELEDFVESQGVSMDDFEAQCQQYATAKDKALNLINMPKDRVDRLANVMIEARANVRYCKECYTLTDKELCPVCANPRRDHRTIMVVENTRDLAAYEKTGKYEGVYHVLHGAISPMLGVGPGDIKLKELMERLQGDVEEVIIATNSSLEGETTAMYISKLIKPTGIKVTRIASGVPVGGDLEYIDEVTLLRALEGRVEL